VTNSKPPKKIVIKSKTSELIKVERFLKEFFDECCVPKESFNKVFLCLSEAVINSIEHGNNNDVNKEVYIFADCVSKSLKVKIKDQGIGFDHKEIPDPTKNENLRKESGRGIHIMKSLSDNIEYKKNEISILFKIDCK
jgi:serine/threonine-protein kinase RsbW